MNLVLFGVYPYLAGTVFIVGSLLRYEREQDGWGAYSSQLLGSRRTMLWASNLWHAGILLVFCGHFVGMATPIFELIGVPPLTHQWIAFSAGTGAGTIAMIGGVMLLFRRFFNSRVRAASRFSDFFILFWLLVTLGLGLVTQASTVRELLQGSVGNMKIFQAYVQGLAILRPQPALLAPVPMIYKIHMLFGMTVFLLFPFTRLVHIWTVPLNYLVRRYQIVRARRAA